MVLRKLHTNGTSTLVAIPRNMLEAAGLAAGSYVQLSLDKDLRICLDPLTTEPAKVQKLAKRSENL